MASHPAAPPPIQPPPRLRHAAAELPPPRLRSKLVNCAQPGTIDERVINDKKATMSRFEISENIQLALHSARGVGCKACGNPPASPPPSPPASPLPTPALPPPPPPRS